MHCITRQIMIILEKKVEKSPGKKCTVSQWRPFLLIFLSLDCAILRKDQYATISRTRPTIHNWLQMYALYYTDAKQWTSIVLSWTCWTTIQGRPYLKISKKLINKYGDYINENKFYITDRNELWQNEITRASMMPKPRLRLIKIWPRGKYCIKAWLKGEHFLPGRN